MDFRYKYDCIIDAVEEHLCEGYEGIMASLERKLFISRRQINEVFSFVSNYTINDYIGKRRICKIYESKIETGKSWDAVSYEFGFNNYTTFNIRFKSLTGMSPSFAESKSKEQMESVFIQPLYLSQILEGAATEITNTKRENNNSIKQIDVSTYRAFEILEEYQSRYGFSDDEIVVIYNLNLKTGISLECLSECLIIEKHDVYECCEDWLRDNYVRDKTGEDETILDEEAIICAQSISDYLDLDFIEAYIYVRCGFSYEMLAAMYSLIKEYDIYPYEAYGFVKEVNKEKYSWSDIDKRYIDLYLGNSDVMLSYSEYQEMIKAIEQLGLTDVDVSDLFSIYIKYEYADSWEVAVQWFIEEMNSVDNDDYCDHIEEFLDMRASERGDNY